MTTNNSDKHLISQWQDSKSARQHLLVLQENFNLSQEDS